MEDEKPEWLPGMPIFAEPLDFFASVPLNYLLDDQGNPYPSDDSNAIGKLLRDIEKRRVALTEKDVAGHHIRVSTVFLVGNRNPVRDKEPILYETMLSIDDFNSLASWLYSTRQESMEGHKEVVKGMEQLLVIMKQQNVDVKQLAKLLE